MKLYRIRNWSEWFENNRSKTVKDLSWVAIPNRHDGENFSAIMLHKRGSEIFSAWILMVQVASRCQPRGTLLRDGGKPHSAVSLSIKTRAPVAWFEIALEFLENETDWVEVEEVAGDCQDTDRQLTLNCQSGAQERKKEGNGKEGSELGTSLSSKRFSKPTVQEMKLYASELGMPESEGETAWHFYESKGWKVGGDPMKSWKSCLVTWKTRYEQRNGKNQQPPTQRKMTDAEILAEACR